MVLMGPTAGTGSIRLVKPKISMWNRSAQKPWICHGRDRYGTMVSSLGRTPKEAYETWSCFVNIPAKPDWSMLGIYGH